METNDNPFASPRAEIDARFMPELSDPAGQLLWRATDTLGRTRPWMRFLGVFAILLSILTAVTSVIGLLTAEDPGAAGEAAGNMIGAAVYVLIGMMMLKYGKGITLHLARPDESSMIHALEAHRSLLKTMGILAILATCVYLLIFIGAMIFAMAVAAA